MFIITNIVIMIVLGCHIKDIQNNRIQTAINYSKNIDSQIWYLTGGVKYDISSNMNEADLMKEFLFSDLNIVTDTTSVNTAENFLNFKKWYIHTCFEEQPQIVITTSSFHKDRAEQIFKGIFHDMILEPIWNLDQFACSTCWSDELIHMRNVNLDIKKALEKQ
jgi:hypothetical protein